MSFDHMPREIMLLEQMSVEKVSFDHMPLEQTWYQRKNNFEIALNQPF